MNNNSNNCGDCGTTCSECGRPWAICKQDGGCGCNKCKDIKFCEYGRMANGCIREKQPGCPMQAVIPSVTIESIDGIKNLADCLVHVSDINTTFYIDDKHRPIVTWAGLISVSGYDVEENPKNFRGQVVYDTMANILVVFDSQGVGHTFDVSETTIRSVVLSAAGWSNEAPYMQTVSLSGVTKFSDLSAPYLSYDATEAENEALSCISGGSTDAGSVTFYCYEEKPTTTITVFMVDKGTKLGSSYPIASATNIGMVKIGDGLNIDQTGKVSVSEKAPDGFFSDSEGTVSGEGATITFEEAAGISFEELKLFGMAIQSGTPAPTSLAAIQTTTGSQSVVINGESNLVSLGSIELLPIGEYGNYIWKDGDEWKIHNGIGKVVFDGSENWKWASVGTTHTFFQLNESDFIGNEFLKGDNEGTPGTIISDRFVNIQANNTTMHANAGIGIRNDLVRIAVPNSIATTIEAFKAWLANNPTTAYYVLLNPTDTIVTDMILTMQLESIVNNMSHNETTTVSVAESDFASIYAKGYDENLAGIVARIDSEIDKIESKSVDENAVINVGKYGIAGLDDSTAKIQELIDYAISKNLVLSFPNKTFKITSIDFKTSKAKFDDTRFVAIGDEDDVAIKFTNPYKGSEYRNFTLDGNGNTGIKVDGGTNILLDHIKVNNCKLGIDVIGKYEVTISNSLIKNDYDIEDSIGLQVTRSDNVFSNIVIQGFRTGVKTLGHMEGTYFDKIHIWSTVADTVVNSIGFDLYSGADLRDCYFDTCRIGIKVRNSSHGVRLNNCRWFWNTDYYTDAILGEADTMLFEFENADCTQQVDMSQCFGYKPSTITEVKFSNLDEEDWKSLCNVAANCKSLFNITEVPIGYVTSFDTPASLTDVTNKIVATDSGVDIDYVGTVASDASAGNVTLGYLASRQFPHSLPLNTFGTYGNQWNVAEGFVYLYINENGKVEVKLTEAMRGKAIKIHVSTGK